MSLVFFDTNVLIYTIKTGDPRQERAIELVTAGGIISVQSLNEFVNVVRRKALLDWPAAMAAEAEILRLCGDPVPLTIDLHRRGLLIAQRYKFALYDSMIVAAALTAGCDVLYSEDLHDGLVIDGRFTVQNPFGQAAG